MTCTFADARCPMQCNNGMSLRVADFTHLCIVHGSTYFVLESIDFIARKEVVAVELS